jgi:hypothetical protein
MTDSSKETLERIARRVLVPEPAYERVLRRRDRRGRNQRIAAGMVGLALFVGTTGIVTIVGALDPARTPTETGAASTGPTAAGPTGIARPVDDFLGSDLPPEGTPPSTPADGELVEADGSTPPGPWWSVNVYADGRVIWLRSVTAEHGWLERRLTPEGLELVRSGGAELWRLPASVPASGWEDPEAKSYVPSRYAVCAFEGAGQLLPQRAKDLLRQADLYPHRLTDGELGNACPALTTEEARILDTILLELAPHRGAADGALGYTLDEGYIQVFPLLPDGTFMECCPG